MKVTTRTQLSSTMFINFFIRVEWFVTLGTSLNKKLSTTCTEKIRADLSQPVRAMVAFFVAGLVADRFFSSQKILGLLHLSGGALLWQASARKTLNANDWKYIWLVPAPIALVVMFIFVLLFRNDRQPALTKVSAGENKLVAGTI